MEQFFIGRNLAVPYEAQTSRGVIVKHLHIANAVLFFVNAALWAFVAKQPALATLWLAVALGEIYIVKRTDLLSN